MAARTDYYAALGVGDKASESEIKRAYRKLARKWHPDVNPGDAAAEERFKEISEAYHVLGDEKRRQQYDRVGPEAFAQEFDLSDFGDQFGSFFRGGFRAGGPGRPGGPDFGMFEEILGGLGGAGVAGGRRQPPRPSAGRDVRVPLRLTFLDAMRGVERTVGYRHGGDAERTRVRIPAGVKDGTTIKVSGKGEVSSSGGPPGSLLLELSVEPHSRLQRRGNDLHTEVPVTVYEAILGGKVRVPTLDGSATINLPQGTRSGQVFRLRGKGVGRESDAGDLLARVVIQAPGEIDDGVVSLMEDFRSRHPYDPREDE